MQSATNPLYILNSKFIQKTGVSSHSHPVQMNVQTHAQFDFRPDRDCSLQAIFQDFIDENC